jgi:SAM-dependent methyltransferase
MYDKVLASIHDQWFDSIAHAAAIHIKRALGNRTVTRVVDLGCGSGVLLEAVLGFTTEGVGMDVSPEMIALAKHRAPQAKLSVGHVFKVDIPPADVVTLVGEVLSYAASSGSCWEEELVAFFSRAHRALGSGGILLFDILGAGHDYSATDFRDEDEFTVRSVTRQDGDLIERKILSVLKTDGAYTKSIEVHCLRAFPSSSIEAALQEVGFVWKRIYQYADLPLLPGRIGYECRRAS